MRSDDQNLERRAIRLGLACQNPAEFWHHVIRSEGTEVMGTGHGLLCMSLKENTDETVFGDLSQEWSYFRGFGFNPFKKLADVGPIVNHVKAGCSIVRWIWLPNREVVRSGYMCLETQCLLTCHTFLTRGDEDPKCY